MEDWASGFDLSDNLDQLESTIINELHTAADQAIQHPQLSRTETSDFAAAELGTLTSSVDPTESLHATFLTRDYCKLQSCQLNLVGTL